DLSNQLSESGRDQEADQVDRLAFSFIEELIANLPETALDYELMAWFLVTCPDLQLWDSTRAAELTQKAVELSQRAVELSPQMREAWNALGVAQYRASNLQDAITALDKSLELEGDHRSALFYLAMAHAQLGDQDEAHQWYDRAIEWMKNNNSDNEMLRRLRAEAEGLLGVEVRGEG
ncbi:unnamed protein product, partial [marine sediment metagenome]